MGAACSYIIIYIYMHLKTKATNQPQAKVYIYRLGVYSPVSQPPTPALEKYRLARETKL